MLRGLGELLIGADPTHTAAAYDRLLAHSYWYGEGGIASLAISALDIALWDLKGQAAGLSLAGLLGGPRVEALPAIAAAHPHGSDPVEMAEQAAELVTGRLAGYKAGLVPAGPARLGRDHARDAAFVAALRAALPEGAVLAVDGRAAVDWDPMTAVRRVRAFEEHGLAWIEEPFAPWDTDGYRTLRERTSTLVACGEREWTVPGYQRLLADGVADIVGVDPGRVGGVTGSVRVMERIAAAGRRLNPHCWSGAVLSAVGLALATVSGTALVFEVKPQPSAAQDELVSDPLRPDGGRIAAPDRPGIGVTVDEDAVARYRVDG